MWRPAQQSISADAPSPHRNDQGLHYKRFRIRVPANQSHAGAQSAQIAGRPWPTCRSERQREAIVSRMTTQPICDRRRTYRVMLLSIVCGLLLGCGGSSSPPTAPSFQAVLTGVPLVIAPRVAASSDGSSWLAWTEGTIGFESIVSARVDTRGLVSKIPVTISPAAAQRISQIVMVGTTPAVAWLQYDGLGNAQANVATYVNGAWRIEFSSGPAVRGDIRLISIPGGAASLVWSELDGLGQYQALSSLRSPSGVWSVQTVLRTVPVGTVVMATPTQAADDRGSQLAIWTEAPASLDTAAQPQTMWTSFYDPVSATWSTPSQVEAGALYFTPDVASTGNSTWVAVWPSGDSFSRTSLLSKRFINGAWDAAASRIDTGQTSNLQSVVVAARNSRAYVAWSGQTADASLGSLRVSSFDASSGTWSPPSLIEGPASGYPVSVRLQTDGLGTVAAAWNVSQGSAGGPFLASTDKAGVWQAPISLDVQQQGLAADLSMFSANDFVTTWYRFAQQSTFDIVVRRLR